MKQRISTEDLKSLTPSQQEKLREWWKPQKGDWFVYIEGLLFFEHFVGECSSYTECECRGEKADEYPERDSLPLLSIGQCIELLESESCYLVTDNEKGKNKYSVIQYDSWAGRHDGVVTDREELIDALWEAVKSIL